MSENKKNFSVRDLCYIAVFAAIIAILAQITIPMPLGVPMTLQTLAVPLAGVVLGKRNGGLAALVYVLLGAVGVPVFAGLTGGIGIVLGMTGGFIVGFPFYALMAGIGVESGSKVKLVCWTVLGSVIDYAIGTVWFVVAADSTFATALTACVIPFIPTEIIKIALAAILGPVLRKALMKAGLLTVSAKAV